MQMGGQNAGLLARLRAPPRRRRRRTARRCCGRSSRAMRDRVSAPTTSAQRALPVRDELVGDAERVNEAGAHRLHVEGGQPCRSRRCCSRQAVLGNTRSGVVVATMIRSMSCGSRPAASSARRAAFSARSHGVFAVGCNVPLADAGALANPLVARCRRSSPGRHWSAPCPADSRRCR